MSWVTEVWYAVTAGCLPPRSLAGWSVWRVVGGLDGGISASGLASLMIDLFLRALWNNGRAGWLGWMHVGGRRSSSRQRGILILGIGFVCIARMHDDILYPGGLELRCCGDFRSYVIGIKCQDFLSNPRTDGPSSNIVRIDEIRRKHSQTRLASPLTSLDLDQS